MIGRVGRFWWSFLAVVLLLAVWLTASGHIWLRGFPLSVWEDLAQGRGLLWPYTPFSGSFTGLLGRLPGDAATWASVATVGLNTLSALALLVATRLAWKNPVSPVLAVGTAYFGAQTMWVKSLTPHHSLLHLVLALALIALMRGAVPSLAGLVLCAAVIEPEQGVMLYLALAYLSYRRSPAYGIAVSTMALFGVGCLLIPLCGGYRLAPGFEGWQLWSGLPLALALWPSSIREARGGIYGSLLLGSCLTGTAELASVLATGDLAFVALSACQPRPQSSAPPGLAGGWRVPSSRLIGLAATCGLVWLVLPGERFLNREVLIPAHIARIPLPHMFTLFSLREHAKSFAQQSWRSRAPFPNLTAADCEVALELSSQELPSGFCPVTLGGLREERQLALVYALISHQKLGGWDDPAHLAAPILLCKLRGKSFLHKGPTLVLRDAGTARPAAPVPLASAPAPLDLRSLMTVAYRRQRICQEKGGAYRWTGAGQVYELSFLEEIAEVILSDRPGDYHITSLAAGAARRSLEVPELKWAVSEVARVETLPSRSLVPVSLRLKNLGTGPLSSEMIESWRLGPLDGPASESFAQKGGKRGDSFTLFPGESVQLDLKLETPEGEGRMALGLDAITPEGKVLRVPVEGSSEVLTWRRMPPVGTWVEEP